MHRRFYSLRSTLTGLCVLFAFVSFASGATVPVTNTNDDGAGSLRQALRSANSGDTIVFNLPPRPPTGPHFLNLASELLIEKSVTIIGPGARTLDIDGSKKVRLFDIAPSAGTVNISGLILSGGLAGNYYSYGGAIYNSATLNVTDCFFLRNTSQVHGGAVFNAGTNGRGAVANFTNCTFEENFGGASASRSAVMRSRLTILCRKGKAIAFT